MPDSAFTPDGAGISQDASYRRAYFPGLVYNQQGRLAEVVFIGGVAHYAIPDDGFLRHVECWAVDQVVIASLREQVTSVQDELVRAMLQMLGKDDLFTKAALDASIRNMEKSILQSDPDQWAPWLKLYGFRIVVDVHGEVVEIMYPQQASEDDE
jgi:hypothetical protein